jgi:excisionase family DNA binding protein
VPVTLRSADASPLSVSLDLAPLVDALGARLEAMLARKFADLAPQTAHEEAVDVLAAAARLGISEAGVWRLIRKGELDSLKVGARRLVPSSAIDAFLQRR